jgi:hypothetical protein
VGTGGNSHYMFSTILPNSEARISNAYAVIKRTLGPASSYWRFIPQAGSTDAGSAG